MGKKKLPREESVLFKRFRLNLERVIREDVAAERKMAENGHICIDPDVMEKIALKDAAKSALKDAERLVSHIKSEYKECLNYKKGIPGWMYSNKGIREMMNKKKLFIPILNYVKNHYLKQNDSREVQNNYGIKDYIHVFEKGKRAGEEIKADYVIVQLNYEEMIDSISSEGYQISIPSVRKYLKAFCDIGILKNLGKRGSNGQNIYASGWWLHYGSSDKRRVFFLKETNNFKTKLREFELE
jgi:hypothetical protein